METNLDVLIDAINHSETAVVSFYCFGELGLEEMRHTVDRLRLSKDEEGYIYFQYQEDGGYYISEHNEIYLEEPDEDADKKFEVRQEGTLLLELRLYGSAIRPISEL